MCPDSAGTWQRLIKAFTSSAQEDGSDGEGEGKKEGGNEGRGRGLEEKE